MLAAQAIVDSVALDVDLDGVDAALRRLDDGTYATCEVCTADLADDVLEADPVARRCPNHPLATTLPGTAPRFEVPAPADADADADADDEDETADEDEADDGTPPPS